MDRLYAARPQLEKTFQKQVENAVKTQSRQRKPLVGMTRLSNSFSETRSSENLSRSVSMAYGRLWQGVIGSYGGFRDLGVGDESGLDIVDDDRKIIMEVKSSHNTDNSNSRTQAFNKLVRFKKSNPDYTPIYGFINTGDKASTKGDDKKILHKGHSIRELSGDALLRFLFGDDADLVVEIVEEITGSSYILSMVLPFR